MKKTNEFLPQNHHSLTELNKIADSANEKLQRDRQAESLAQRLTVKLWERMAAMYGHKFTSQFGESPDETWERCLRGIDGDQVAKGLSACLVSHPEWPPGAAQFRALCLGLTIDKDGYDASWQHALPAYIDINDPRHPSNNPDSPEFAGFKLEDATSKERTRAKGRETMDSLKSLFRYSPDEQTEDSEEAAA